MNEAKPPPEDRSKARRVSGGDAEPGGPIECAMNKSAPLTVVAPEWRPKTRQNVPVPGHRIVCAVSGVWSRFLGTRYIITLFYPHSIS